MEYYDIEIPRRLSDIEYPAPSDLSVAFRYDASIGGLVLSVTADDLPLSYLGRGKICFYDGFIRLTALAVIDPFLVARNHVPGKNLKIFLKAIYPKLLREKLPVSVDLTLYELPVVTISVSDVSGDTVTCHIRWVDGGQNAAVIDGMDGYVLVERSIYKGNPRFLSLVPKRENGAYIAKGEDAKQLGKLCDLAGYMFCGAYLNDLRILGRGLTPPRREMPPAELTFDNLFADLRTPKTEPTAAQEAEPIPAAPVIKPVTKKYDGPSLLSIRMRASAREMNTISARFAADAVKFGTMKGTPCAYTPLRSYWPTYTGMTEPQKQYYLWFRTSFMAGETPKTDLSYIFIAVYELINHGFPPSEEQFRILMRYWTAYRETFPRLDLYLPRWAVDYILTNKLSVPLSEVVCAVPEAAAQFEEIIDVALNDAMKEGLHTLPAPLWKYFCVYDVTTSKLWQGEHRSEFESALRKVFSALDDAIRKTKDTSLLTLYRPPAVQKEYTAFTGAVCARQYRRQIRAEFHPITKSAKLHALLESVAKYTENTLRIRHKIMGRLRVGTLPDPIRALIDAILAQNDPAAAVQPKKPLVIDISQAMALEQSSWDNTKKLLDAVGETDIPDEITPDPMPDETKSAPAPSEPAEAVSDTSDDPETFFHTLTDLQRNFLFAVMDGASQDTLEALCMNEFLLPDAVADEINERAADYFGDIILENNTILDDYLEFLTQQRKKYNE